MDTAVRTSMIREAIAKDLADHPPGTPVTAVYNPTGDPPVIGENTQQVLDALKAEEDATTAAANVPPESVVATLTLNADQADVLYAAAVTFETGLERDLADAGDEASDITRTAAAAWKSIRVRVGQAMGWES